MKKRADTQAEIAKLEKKVVKLTGDLAAKRRLDALQAEAEGLQEALKAEPCKQLHYPAPCPLPHYPWIRPYHAHPWNCRCGDCSCAPIYPWTSRPSIWMGNTGVTSSGGQTISGGMSCGSTVVLNGNVCRDSNNLAGTQVGPDGVPFTYTAGHIIGKSEN